MCILRLKQNTYKGYYKTLIVKEILNGINLIIFTYLNIIQEKLIVYHGFLKL